MENKENIITKALGWIKSHIAIVSVALVVIIALIVCLSIFTGGPKKTVKKYVSALNKQDVEKVIECMDFAGEEAWGYYDIDEFTAEDYAEFMQEYSNVDSEDVSYSRKWELTSLTATFAEFKVEYKKFNVKIEEFKDVIELGKDLYAVKAKVSVYAKPIDKEITEEIDETEIMTFIVYKNKIVDGDLYI